MTPYLTVRRGPDGSAEVALLPGANIDECSAEFLETLHAEFDRTTNGTGWRVPARDAAGLESWLRVVGAIGSEEIRQADPGDAVHTVYFYGGSVAVGTRKGVVDRPEVACAGYGVLHGQTKRSQAIDFDQISPTTQEPLLRVLRIRHLADEVNTAARTRPSCTLEEGDSSLERVDAADLELAGKGYRLLQATTATPQNFVRSIAGGQRGDHVLVLSEDECSVDGQRLRTRDLPFHLMCDAPETEFGRHELADHVLGLKFALGVDAPQRILALPEPHGDLRVLLVGTKISADLESLEARLNLLGHHCDLERATTAEAFQAYFGACPPPDIIHFSAHNPGARLKLTRGFLVPADIEKALAPWRATERPVSLCFLNTCSGAAQTTNSPTKETLAETVLKMGARCVVATSAPVPFTDKSGRSMANFAGSFYGELLRGATVGRALLHARREDFVDHGQLWPKYVLIGNPATRLIPPRPAD